MQTPNAHILLVEDDLSHCTILQALINGWGYRVSVAHNGRQALEQVMAQPFDLILSDVRMAEMDGIAALKAIKSYNPAIPILIMTAYSNVESAVEAIKAGAYDYLTKPLDFDTLQLTLARALEHTSLKSENQDLKQRLRFEQQNFIGRSEPMRKLLEMIAMIAPSEATVLISGESGTGKELIARAVHANSLRKDRPLVSINCAALSESLLESELFGHEKGAFTGADKRREGRFMEADQGTLFLDEIGEVSPLMQAKLLRAIQEREIQRVGSNQTLSVDVRLIAATNRDLLADVEAGRFRQDLYYRLNVVTVDSPPLRARREDIPLLAMHFLAKFAERNRKTVKGFTPLAMDMLLKYPWPGNVRELENSVERGVILLSGDFISEKELPLSVSQCADVQPDRQCGQAIQPLEQVEKQAILAALEQTAGNKTEAAKQLGITRKTLLAKLQK
ncbi:MULTISPECIES: sigma 54-interacting transcriptional regulator [Serratia]|uniref:Sigma 54-interacting transcriptional regulator n=1 Tax=Serratia fonticola TaxID=47917 RepID=A0AAJ1YFY8_SERFO|nr:MULTISPECIES: sigma 54-interacting transcriptional regulator [Serratia]MBE0152181.1 response regulator [Serratia fonticola]MDQ7212682.1 sigma 54-interacting transcriptional regulator [Serratia fonticola]MDQ9128926.1 sigma 54-interacting transcriptional regulator [Serratia fonticola]OKP24655.1 two-component system response regulator [Serratia fonticola]HBE9082907.1 sigma 54-interacting transcriptional regulator [Serratia fonticola]